MTAWRKVRLGDVARIKHGYAFTGMSGDVPAPSPVVIGIGNFDYAGGFRFQDTTLKRLAGDYPSAFALSPGDVLLAMTCQTPDGEILGIPGRVPEDGVTYLHNQRLGKVEVLGDAVDLGFMFQLARWSEFNRHLFITASGSKILHTSPSRIEDFEFALPPLDEQRAIAAALGAFDKKIEFNRRIVALIPALIEARITQALAKGHVRVPVSALGRFVNGGAYTKGASGTGRMVIRIAELNNGPGISTIFNEIDVPDDKTARSGDILMSWSGSLGVYRWVRDEAIINQHIFKVIPDGYPSWLVFDRLTAAMGEFRSIASDKATTMGHIQRGHLESTSVIVPLGPVIKSLNEDLEPLWDRLLLAERESLKLAALRDALLPELLSGSLRAGDAKNSVTVAGDKTEG